jgi:hypothetical protein
MIQIGNHSKQTIAHAQRDRVRQFYGDICECRIVPSPRPDLDLFEFAGGFIVGVFYADDTKVLPEAEHRKAIWLEIQASDPKALEDRITAAGIERMHYDDQSRFYFQAPGGQVFRIAPLDGGV